MWVNSGQEIREQGGGTGYKGNPYHTVGLRSLYPERLNIKARGNVEIMTHALMSELRATEYMRDVRGLDQFLLFFCLRSNDDNDQHEHEMSISMSYNHITKP
jgi:hypothetical protein